MSTKSFQSSQSTRRSFLPFQKRSPPSSFSACFTSPTQSKPIDDSLMLPLECAIVLPFVDSITIDKYFVAVGNLLGGTQDDFKKIIYGGKNGSRVVMHLSSPSVLNDFISKNETVTIENKVLPVKKLIDPGLVLYLLNVVPHLPNSLLEIELQKYVSLQSNIELSSYGMRDHRLSHILAYKRQVKIKTNEKEKIPAMINVTYMNVTYPIYLSCDNVTRCFSCGKEGHMAKSCTEPPKPKTPAQDRLDSKTYNSPVSNGEEKYGNDRPPLPNDSMDEENDFDFDSSKVSTQVSKPSESSSSSVDFFPPFNGNRSSSLPSLVVEDNEMMVVDDNKFPALSPPPSAQETPKKRVAPVTESHNEKKMKTNTQPPDVVLSEGFKAMVTKIIDEAEEDSVSTDEICGLLAKLKNSQKQKEIVQESKLPIDVVKNIFQLIHTNPDTSTNIKSRVGRLLTNVLVEPKMVLKNVPST